MRAKVRNVGVMGWDIPCFLTGPFLVGADNPPIGCGLVQGQRCRGMAVAAG